MVAGPAIAGVGAYLWVARRGLTSSYEHLRDRTGWNPTWAKRADVVNTRLGPVFLMAIGVASFVHGLATL